MCKKDSYQKENSPSYIFFLSKYMCDYFIACCIIQICRYDSTADERIWPHLIDWNSDVLQSINIAKILLRIYLYKYYIIDKWWTCEINVSSLAPTAYILYYFWNIWYTYQTTDDDKDGNSNSISYALSRETVIHDAL